MKKEPYRIPHIAYIATCLIAMGILFAYTGNAALVGVLLALSGALGGVARNQVPPDNNNGQLQADNIEKADIEINK